MRVTPRDGVHALATPLVGVGPVLRLGDAPERSVSYLVSVRFVRAVGARMHGRRAFVGDALLAAAVTVMVLVDLSSASDTHPGERATDVWAVLLSLLQTVPLAFRRHAPLAMFGLILLGVGIYYPLGYEVTDGTLATFIGVYSVAAYEDDRKALLGLGLLAVGMTWYWSTRVEPFDVTTPVWIGLLGILSWGLGRYVAQRQTYIAEIEALAKRLDHARELETRQAVWRERARLARELHDSIGHAVNVMLIQAGAGRRTLKSDQGPTEKALRAIESTGRETLGELDRLLGILRTEDEDADLPPQLGLGHLRVLAGRFEDSGLPVDIKIEGNEVVLPRSLDHSAFRIVQEALTNSLRHAKGATAHVSVCYGHDRLELEVTDDGSPGGGATELGAGRGLIGIRERVALFDGHLETGPRPEGGFVVRCHLPLPANKS
jgi:signal transduction histidine kinase